VPSHLGYEYVQRLLASQGYATVSISANAINGQDFASEDGGAAARSALVRHHLGLIANRASDPARPRWFGRVDVEQTVLVGHSRGGEGVARAVVDSRLGAPWDVRGQVLVAPTNFAYRSTSYVPSVTLLPYCDGDVFDLQGQQYTDLPRDLASDDTAFRSSVLMRGANHNFFNVQWTPGPSVAPSFDDWSDDDNLLCGRDSATRLTARQQRAAGKAWIAGAVQLFASGDTDVLPLFDSAGPVTVASAADAAVRTHALGGDRVLVRPGNDAALSGSGQYCRALASGGPAACGADVNLGREVHWLWGLPPGFPAAREMELSWAGPGTAGGLDLAGPLDLTGAGTTLDLRTVVDPAVRALRLRVRLTDSGGDRWTAPAQRLGGLRGAYARTYWAQTLRVDLGAAPPRLDRAAVTDVELVSASERGRVWLLDLAARREGLLPVPDKRMPLLSLGPRVRVAEGDDPSAAVDATYTLDQPAPADADFMVVTTSYTTRLVSEVIEVHVPEGATEGTFEVPVGGNDVDSLPRRFVLLEAYAVSGMVVGDGVSAVLVRDDDPDARMRVRPQDRSVAPGDPMVWVVRLDRPTDYESYLVGVGVVTDPRSGNLRVSDVPARWARRHLGTDLSPAMPVARRLYTVAELGPGERAASVQVPTRARPPTPGSRTLTLRFAHRLLADGPVRVTIRRE
jgi:hypothetical protein